MAEPDDAKSLETLKLFRDEHQRWFICEMAAEKAAQLEAAEKPEAAARADAVVAIQKVRALQNEVQRILVMEGRYGRIEHHRSDGSSSAADFMGATSRPELFRDVRRILDGAIAALESRLPASPTVPIQSGAALADVVASDLQRRLTDVESTLAKQKVLWRRLVEPIGMGVLAAVIAYYLHSEILKTLVAPDNIKLIDAQLQQLHRDDPGKQPSTDPQQQGQAQPTQHPVPPLPSAVSPP